MIGRGQRLTELLHEAAPPAVLLAAALLTQLGDTWLLFLFGAAVYLFAAHVPWERGEAAASLFPLALVLVSSALSITLKLAFDLPRPPGADQAPALGTIPGWLEAFARDATTAETRGFPSGHALGTTMVWGGAALAIDVGRRRDRLVAAGLLVVLVSLTRVVLGLHHPLDVVVGAGVGVLALVALYRLTEHGRDPRPVVALAAILGLLALGLEATSDTVLVFGTAAGGWVAWELVVRLRERWQLGDVRGLPLVGAGVVMALAAATLWSVHVFEPALGLALAGSLLGGVLTVGAPALGQVVHRAASNPSG